MNLKLASLAAIAAAAIALAALHPGTTAAAPTEQTGFACSPLGTRIELLCTVTNFAVVNNQLVASGTITNPQTGLNLPFTNVPVSNLTSGPGNSCRILDLQLGPIDLDLLGLGVETNQINLGIRAERGPGNLLGNLLCAITGRFDANAPLNLVAGLLNYLIGVKGGAQT